MSQAGPTVGRAEDEKGSQGSSQDVPGCEESRQGELKATVQGDYWSGLEMPASQRELITACLLS